MVHSLEISQFSVVRKRLKFEAEGRRAGTTGPDEGGLPGISFEQERKSEFVAFK